MVNEATVPSELGAMREMFDEVLLFLSQQMESLQASSLENLVGELQDGGMSSNAIALVKKGAVTTNKEELQDVITRIGEFVGYPTRTPDTQNLNAVVQIFLLGYMSAMFGGTKPTKLQQWFPTTF